MFYEVVAAVIAILGVVLLLLALRTLLRGGWLLGWVKGMLGMGLAALALVLVLAAWDLLSYDELSADKPLANISFEQLAEGQFQAILIIANDPREQKFELHGDQWQLDARILKWHDSLRRFGLKTGYRLERLAGRYYDLENERSGRPTAYNLHTDGAGVDVWEWFNRVDQQIPWLDAFYGNATFAPMRDGALYEISLSLSGLASRPLNDSAKKALQRWQ